MERRRRRRTFNNLVFKLQGQNVVKWDEEILLPSERSSVVSFEVYAFFEPGLRRGEGVLLRQVRIPVREVLELIECPVLEDRAMPLCLSLRIVTERRMVGVSDSRTMPDPPDVDETRLLESLTQEGHDALQRYCERRDQIDLDEAITCFQRVEEMCPVDHPNRSAALFNLANAKFTHSLPNSISLDLYMPIALYWDAIYLQSQLTDHSVTTLELGLTLLAHLQGGEQTDRRETMHSGSFQAKYLDDTDLIRRSRYMLLSLSGVDPRRPTLLAGLGSLYHRRFRDNSDPFDISEAISMLELAVELTPEDHPAKPHYLNALGRALSSRFELLDDIADVRRSISIFGEAVYLARFIYPDDLTLRHKRRFISMSGKVVYYDVPFIGLDRAILLINFGFSLSRCFQRLCELTDMERSIWTFEEVVRLTPDDHFDKPNRLNILGSFLLRCFEQLGDFEDIVASISVFEDAVRLTPDEHPDKPNRLNNLGCSLSGRFEWFGDLGDITRSISVFEDAVRLTPDGHPDKPSRLDNLASSLLSRFECPGDPLICVQCTSTKDTLSRYHTEDDYHQNKLAQDLGNPTKYSGDLVHLEKSIVIFEEVVRLTPGGHPEKAVRLNKLGSSLFARFECLGDLVALERSILMFEEAIHLTPDQHPDKPDRLKNLGNALLHRFAFLSDLVDLDKSISIFQEAVHLIPRDHPAKSPALDTLRGALSHRFEHVGDLKDLETFVLMFEEVLRLTPDGHPGKAGRLNHLGRSLFWRFKYLGDHADLVKSISIFEEAVRSTPNGYLDKLVWLTNLGSSFMERFSHSGDLSHLAAATFHFSLTSQDPVGSLSIRFRAVCCWISSVLHQGDTRPLLDAYSTAISLLLHSAWLGLSPSGCQLGGTTDVIGDAVVAALEAGYPELAIEWFEKGRLILLYKCRQLPTPVDQLRTEHPSLAHEFEQAIKNLEHDHFRVHSALERPGTNCSLEIEAEKDHELALRWREKLLVNIRSLPGFDGFLLPKTIDPLGLITSASSGPVIYLNASQRRCDALIVSANLGVIPVPLHDVSYEDLQAMVYLLPYRGRSIRKPCFGAVVTDPRDAA